ncbi:hypothetical protein PJP14_29335, partial [Mycobacterium kansasii]
VKFVLKKSFYHPVFIMHACHKQDCVFHVKQEINTLRKDVVLSRLSKLSQEALISLNVVDMYKVAFHLFGPAMDGIKNHINW